MKQAQAPSVEVLKDPALYVDLLLLEKRTEKDCVQLASEGAKRPTMLTGSVMFDHVNHYKGHLQCNQNAIYISHYSFQVFVKSFMPLPIFRYEADGTSHDNKVPFFGQRKVKTPHYQRFDDASGHSVAYRTEFIEENEKELSENILLSLSEFCGQCSMYSNSGQPLQITRQLEAFVSLPDSDVHEDLTFEA